MNCVGAAAGSLAFSTIQNTPDMSLSGVWPLLDPGVALLFQLLLSSLLRSDGSVQPDVSALGDSIRIAIFVVCFIIVGRGIICAWA